MKTIEVTDVAFANIHHVHSVFCEVSRDKYDGKTALRFFVWGVESTSPWCDTNILVGYFTDPDQAMDLVEKLRAEIEESEEEKDGLPKRDHVN